VTFVVALLILLVSVPIYLKDVGTVGYKALIYKILKNS